MYVNLVLDFQHRKLKSPICRTGTAETGNASLSSLSHQYALVLSWKNYSYTHKNNTGSQEMFTWRCEFQVIQTFTENISPSHPTKPQVPLSSCWHVLLLSGNSGALFPNMQVLSDTSAFSCFCIEPYGAVSEA